MEERQLCEKHNVHYDSATCPACDAELPTIEHAAPEPPQPSKAKRKPKPKAVAPAKRAKKSPGH